MYAIIITRLQILCLYSQTVLLEKKKLLQQWNNTLIGMRRRDEAYAAILSAMGYTASKIIVNPCLGVRTPQLHHH